MEYINECCITNMTIPTDILCKIVKCMQLFCHKNAEKACPNFRMIFYYLSCTFRTLINTSKIVFTKWDILFIEVKSNLGKSLVFYFYYQFINVEKLNRVFFRSFLLAIARHHNCERDNRNISSAFKHNEVIILSHIFPCLYSSYARLFKLISIGSQMYLSCQHVITEGSRFT